MNSAVEYIIRKLKECDDFHNRCDYLLDHSEITYLLEYIKELENRINKEKITCKIPKKQINISAERDNECLIWINPKVINMASTIDKLQQENKQLKERFNNLKEEYKDRTDTVHELYGRIDKAIEYINENSHYYNADGEIMFTIEEEKEETFCKDLLEILKGEDNE